MCMQLWSRLAQSILQAWKCGCRLCFASVQLYIYAAIISYHLLAHDMSCIEAFRATLAHMHTSISMSVLNMKVACCTAN